MKNLGRYLVILTFVMVLWNTIIIKPLKIFTVFLHEIGHATMAFIFGYGISGFNVSFNESGYTMAYSKGWFSSFMITNGGYLGSVLFALFILKSKSNFLKKYVIGILAIVFLLISIKYSGLSGTLLYAIIFAILVILVYMSHNEKLNEWIIDILGISSLAYAMYDTFVDTILLQINDMFNIFSGLKGQMPQTDAVKLSQMTYIPAIVWGFIWIIISIVAVKLVLFGKKSKTKNSWRK